MVSVSEKLGTTVFIMVLGIIFVIGRGMAEDEIEARQKRAVMVIAKDGFRDEELKIPMGILEKAGVEVTIASSTSGMARGIMGSEVEPDILLGEVKASDYDAIIFVGGPGAKEYWDNPVAHNLAREALALNKILGAICIGPVILANAGILSGKEATVWFTEAERLTQEGAIYTGKPVAIDTNVITANGPQSAEEFGKAILEALE